MEKKEQFLEKARTLYEQWKSLKYGVEKENELDYPHFKKTFSDTYEILKECAKGSAIDKAYLELIIGVNNFVNIPDISTINRAFAALVLTERMLQRCVFEEGTEKSAANEATLYLLEERQAVRVDFEKIDDSIQTIEDLLQKSYWKNI